MSNRVRIQVFIEPELKAIMRAQSKRLSGCTNPFIGSESWYARQAVIEKIHRDFPQVVNIESVKSLFESNRL